MFTRISRSVIPMILKVPVVSFDHSTIFTFTMEFCCIGEFTTNRRLAVSMLTMLLFPSGAELL